MAQWAKKGQLDIYDPQRKAIFTQYWTTFNDVSGFCYERELTHADFLKINTS